MVPARTSTEQISVVVPAFDSTVTITELGQSFIDSLDSDHRATLVLVAGPTPGQVFSLGDDTVIGRDPTADIRLEDSAVSRRHARLFTEHGTYYVEDLDSSNGTLVMGVRVSRRELVSGDRIQLGPRIVLRFALLDEAEEAMHRQLFEGTTRDALTGAFNKKYITERLAAEVAHGRRHVSPLEVIVFDLDRFKQVNDVHGHLVGDAVLRAVSGCVHALIRSEDVFGRFGGEEFVVLTRGADAYKLAERIRAAIEQLVAPGAPPGLHISVSLGVARLDELDSVTPTGLIDLADQRLLHAKRSGRNRVCADGTF